MIFTKGEIEVLGLCALCKDLPVETGGISEQEAIDVLLSFGLIRKSRSGLSFRVSNKGYDYLESLGLNFERDKTYLGKSKALYRRIEMAKITAFFLKGGAQIFNCETVNSNENNIFIPSFTFRRNAFSNPLGSTRLSGFYYLRDTMFVPYFISKDNNGIYTNIEEKTFSTELMLKNHKPMVVFTGDGDLSEVISVSHKQLEKKEKVNTDSYCEAITKFRVPVAFIPLDANGFDVLNIISVNGYRQKLAKLLLGKEYAVPDLAYSDGIINKTKGNLLIGFDCNLERMKNVIRQSKNTTHIVLLPFQKNTVLKLLKGENAILHIVEVETVEEMLGISKKSFMLSNEPYRNQDGNYAYAPKTD